MIRNPSREAGIETMSMVSLQVLSHWGFGPSKYRSMCKKCVELRARVRAAATHKIARFVSHGGHPGCTPEAAGLLVALGIPLQIGGWVPEQYCGEHAGPRAAELGLRVVEDLATFLAMGERFRSASYLHEGDPDATPEEKVALARAAEFLASVLKTSETKWPEVFRELDTQGVPPAISIEACVATGMMDPGALMEMAEHYRIPTQVQQDRERLCAMVARANYETRRRALLGGWKLGQVGLHAFHRPLLLTFAYREGADPREAVALAESLGHLLPNGRPKPDLESDSVPNRAAIDLLEGWPGEVALQAIIARGNRAVQGLTGTAAAPVTMALLRRPESEARVAAFSLLQACVVGAKADLQAMGLLVEGEEALVTLFKAVLREHTRAKGARRTWKAEHRPEWAEVGLWAFGRLLLEGLTGQGPLDSSLVDLLVAAGGNTTNADQHLRGEAHQVVGWIIEKVQGRPGEVDPGLLKRLYGVLWQGMRDRSPANRASAQKALEALGLPLKGK